MVIQTREQSHRGPTYNLQDRDTMIFNTESKVEQDPNGEFRLNWENAED